MQVDDSQEPRHPDASGAAVHTEIQDLKQLVKLALRQRQHPGVGGQPKAILFLAPRTPILPAALIEDAALAPMDKVVWIILRKRLDEGSAGRTVPSHRALARATGIASRKTISTSLAMLRCRRYLSVCASAWHSGGKLVGQAYAIHAAPLPVADALFLDPGYPSFVNDLLLHPVARVQKAARQQLEALQE